MRRTSMARLIQTLKQIVCMTLHITQTNGIPVAWIDKNQANIHSLSSLLAASITAQWDVEQSYLLR